MKLPMSLAKRTPVLVAIAGGALLLAICWHATRRPPQETSTQMYVDEIALSYVSNDGPGLAIAVVRNGVVVVRKGYGLSDVASGSPVKADSVFDLASLGKQFTGAAILLLVERGQLSMDDDVRKYVPQVPVFNAARPIRISDLSHHISGLPDFKYEEGGSATNSDILEWLTQQKSLAFEPGTRWQYCNLNYILLAHVVERVSGKTYGAFLRDEIFRPARMIDAQVLENPKDTIRKRVTGYCLNRTPCRRDVGDVGAANVFASLDDMVAWDAAWARDLIVPTRSLVREAHAVQLDSGMPVTYALGWDLRSHREHEFMWHDGDWLGASTYIARYLDTPLTVIVLSNQARLPVAEIQDRVAEVFLR